MGNHLLPFVELQLAAVGLALSRNPKQLRSLIVECKGFDLGVGRDLDQVPFGLSFDFIEWATGDFLGDERGMFCAGAVVEHGPNQWWIIVSTLDEERRSKLLPLLTKFNIAEETMKSVSEWKAMDFIEELIRVATKKHRTHPSP